MSDERTPPNFEMWQTSSAPAIEDPEFVAAHGLNGVGLAITGREFATFLLDRAPDRKCNTCFHSQFSMTGSPDEFIGQFGVPTTDMNSFVPVATYACTNCGAMYQVFWAVVARWLYDLRRGTN